jgi:hypothetical protein
MNKVKTGVGLSPAQLFKLHLMFNGTETIAV